AVAAVLVINVIVLAPALGAVSLWTQPVLRLIAFRPRIAWVVLMVAITVAVVPVVTLPAPVVAVAPAWALGCGILVLLAGLAGDIARTRRASAQEGQDVLATPLEGPEPADRRSRRSRWMTAVRLMLIPAATVVT